MGVNGFGVVVGDLIYFNGGVGILSGGGANVCEWGKS